LEDRLLENIPELKQIVISIEAYQMAKKIVLPKFGKKIGELESFEKIGPKRKARGQLFQSKKTKIM